MSKLVAHRNNAKMPPSTHKFKRNSFSITQYRKHGLLRNNICSCKDSTYEKSDSNAIIGKDGALVSGHKCQNCHNTIYKCQSCATIRNFYKDRKATHRHLREHHQVMHNEENAREGNDAE